MENISVVIPTYNRAALLRRAIETVIQGTSPEDEIIVVDDGSTDETSQVPANLNARYAIFQSQMAGRGLPAMPG